MRKAHIYQFLPTGMTYTFEPETMGDWMVTVYMPTVPYELNPKLLSQAEYDQIIGLMTSENKWARL